jgi:TolA-binding protein
MKYIVSLIFFVSILSAEEPSLLGSELTQSDTAILENRQAVIKNKRAIQSQSIIIEELQESVEGIRSVVDSINSKVGRTGEKISKLNAASAQISEDDLAAIRTEIDDLRSENEQKFKEINQALQKLTSMIATINDVPITTDVKKKKKSVMRDTIPRSNKELVQSAIKHFRAQEYSKAYTQFKELAEKSYLPAKTNFYLGEISYYTQKYEDAIVYFKKSAGYYDRATYMPTLLLHTALSFNKIGDDASAQKFFDALLNTYPDSNQAKSAHKYMD